MHSSRPRQSSRKDFHPKKTTHHKVNKSNNTVIFERLQAASKPREVEFQGISFKFHGLAWFFVFSFLLNCAAAAYSAQVPNDSKMKELIHSKLPDCPRSMTEAFIQTANTNSALYFRFLQLFSDSRVSVDCSGSDPHPYNYASIYDYYNWVILKIFGEYSTAEITQQVKLAENLVRHTSNDCNVKDMSKFQPTIISANLPLYKAALDAGDDNILHFKWQLSKYKALLRDLELINVNDTSDVSVHLPTISKLVYKHRHPQVNKAFTDAELAQLKTYFDAARDCLPSFLPSSLALGNLRSIYDNSREAPMTMQVDINVEKYRYVHAYDSVANLVDDVKINFNEQDNHFYSETVQLSIRDAMTTGGLSQNAIKTFYPSLPALMEADEAYCNYRSKREL